MKHLKVFTAPQCPPCKALKPLLADLPIHVVMIDTHEKPNVAAMHHVRSVPVLKLYDDDVLVRTHVGGCTKQFLTSFIQ